MSISIVQPQAVSYPVLSSTTSNGSSITPEKQSIKTEASHPKLTNLVIARNIRSATSPAITGQNIENTTLAKLKTLITEYNQSISELENHLFYEFSEGNINCEEFIRRAAHQDIQAAINNTPNEQERNDLEKEGDQVGYNNKSIISKHLSRVREFVDANKGNSKYNKNNAFIELVNYLDREHPAGKHPQLRPDIKAAAHAAITKLTHEEPSMSEWGYKYTLQTDAGSYTFRMINFGVESDGFESEINAMINRCFLPKNNPNYLNEELMLSNIISLFNKHDIRISTESSRRFISDYNPDKIDSNLPFIMPYLVKYLRKMDHKIANNEHAISNKEMLNLTLKLCQLFKKLDRRLRSLPLQRQP